MASKIFESLGARRQQPKSDRPGTDSDGRKTPTQDDNDSLAQTTESLSINIPGQDSKSETMPKKKKSGAGRSYNLPVSRCDAFAAREDR